MRRALRISFSIVLFLTLWETVSRSGLVQPTLFPPPSQVAYAFKEMTLTGELVRDIRASLWRALVGFSVGSVVGTVLGLVTGRVPIVDHYISPVLQLFRPLPPVAMIPLIIVWFGIGEVSKLFAIAFAVFFPVWISAHVGAHQVPETFIWSARTLRVKGAAVLWKVIFPSALPIIVGGLRTAIAVAFVMVFVSELAGASAGIGYQISVSYLAYRVDRMVAALVVLGVFGAAADFALSRGLWLMFPWLRLLRQN
jgi:ABC-type nitrate/sulfonate/bicarbonate transport system permease component